MKLLHHCYVIGAFSLLLGACSQEAMWDDNTGNSAEGTIKLNLSVSERYDSRNPSTRADYATIVAPPSSEFGITVRKLDGSYTKTYTKLQQFAEEADFPVGSYELDAFYGTPETQGKAKDGEVGYEHSYFFGTSEPVTVVEGKETTVDLVAKLANAAVEVRYSDNFKGYFKDWATTLKSDNHESVDFGKKDGIGYVTPGQVAVTIKGKLQNGKDFSVTPAAFSAVAQQLHRITYDIHNGEVEGIQKLEVRFQDLDSIEVETILVPISGDLINSDKPVVSKELTFDSRDTDAIADSTCTVQNGVTSSKASFSVVARAGFESATLSIDASNGGVVPGNLRQINLCTADLNALKQTGIDARGFAGEGVTMGNVSITEFISQLTPGSYTFTFNAIDKLQQSGDEAKLLVDVVDTEATYVSGSAVYGSGYAELVVSYDGPDPTVPGSNPFSFKVYDDPGIAYDAEIVSIDNKAYGTRAFDFPSKTYTYKVRIPSDLKFNEDKVRFDIFYGKSNTKIASDDVEFTFPAYEVETDAFAKSVRLRLKKDAESEANKAIENKSLIYNRLKIYVDGTQKEATLSNDGIYTIEGLTPNTGYSISTTLKKSGAAQTTETVTTEAATPVPNGDFSSVKEGSLKFDDLQLGGMYHVGALNYSVYTSILRDEPDGGWANVNAKTAYKNAQTLNTWFTVPSTWVENGKTVIRSVGYKLNGSTPETSPGTSFNFSTTYYCTTVPTFSESDRASGELFLGSYSFNGQETREEGISFSSRPVSLSFDYTYSPYGNEHGLVEVKIYDAFGNILASNSIDLTLQSDTATGIVKLGNYDFGSKASKLCISFRSTKGSTIGLNIPSGSALDEGTNIPASRKSTIAVNAYKTFASGSVLTIDNVILNY